jgi:hypothetical protein
LAVKDRSGDFLLKKAVTAFEGGDPVGLKTKDVNLFVPPFGPSLCEQCVNVSGLHVLTFPPPPQGRVIDLSLTLDAIAAISSDLLVLFQDDPPDPPKGAAAKSAPVANKAAPAAPAAASKGGSSGNFYMAAANLKVTPAVGALALCAHVRPCS